MKESEMVELLKKGVPFENLNDIRMVDIRWRKWTSEVKRATAEPDVELQIDFGGKLINVYGELKTQVTPKILEQLGPWFVRMSNKPNSIWVIISPYLSSDSQRYCQENAINFIDLSGNILLRKPGEIFIQRLNQPNMYKMRRVFRKPFGGVSSRVIRVLLQSPNKRWIVTDIYKEMVKEEQRSASLFRNREATLPISISSISKTIKSLEEELLIRRDGLKILVPEPRQLLFRWAEKYREDYKKYIIDAFKTNNPFGFALDSSIKGLISQIPDIAVLITGSAAASLVAPFVNVDQIDLFILFDTTEDLSQTLNNKQSVGPELMFIYPYDAGVALYSREISGVLIASDIQIYLDCYARGGRDAKQAEYILTNVIEKLWAQK